jgi:DNA-binding response OmpR family regulator
MKVLIYDDEVDVLQLYRMILEKRGYEVLTFDNCNDLIPTIDLTHPDVIIMDNEMPGISGVQATKSIKGDIRYAHIPVISCSANTEGKKLAAEAHADMFLPKPFSIQGLEAAIKQVAA